jgi:hypothetical protein
MKRILLTTTALTMTAGIAAADVSITGDFRLGFNDTDSDAPAAVPVTTHDNKLGVYNDAGIAIAMSSTLDNGMSAGITVDLDGNDFASQAKDRYTFSLSNDSTNVSFGSVEYSARTNWTSAGDMATDGWANQNSDDKNVLRANTTVGGLKVSVSQSVDADSTTASSDPISLSISGSLGGASYVIANEGSTMGIAATTAVGGSTVTTAYSTTPSMTAAAVAGPPAVAATYHASQTDTSTGIKIAYPMGAITATASYVMESKGANSVSAASDSWNISAVWTSGDTKVTFATDENSDNKIEGSTKLGAATVAAGMTDYLEDMYLSVTNPLGGGASIMASYAIDGNDGVAGGSGDAKDEVGGPDLQEGLTIELKFAF